MGANKHVAYIHIHWVQVGGCGSASGMVYNDCVPSWHCTNSYSIDAFWQWLLSLLLKLAVIPRVYWQLHHAIMARVQLQSQLNLPDGLRCAVVHGPDAQLHRRHETKRPAQEPLWFRRVSSFGWQSCPPGRVQLHQCLHGLHDEKQLLQGRLYRSLCEFC